MELLQLNKFGDLHNGRNIIFCKTELLKDELIKIGKIKNEVILISGNADEGIDSSHISIMPDNIKLWYCQNNLVFHDKLRSIPIGLENTVINKRKGHGVAWPHAVQKIQLLNDAFNGAGNEPPSKFLYANFNTKTNPIHRDPVKNTCISSPFITWDEPSLSYPDFIKSVLDHEATICPAGNGIDTHRLYEILYCKRVAVTFKIGDFPVYKDLYEKLPVVILNTVDDLKDHDRLQELIGIAKQKKENLELLDFNFWRQLITNVANEIFVDEKNIFNRFLSYVNKTP